MSRKNILVVDFDYFFPNPMEAGEGRPDIGLYDWGHREAPFFIEDIWPMRARAFYAAGYELPQTALVADWWRRFRFAPGTELLLCDSNAHAGNLSREALGGNLGEVWLFDAHHDAGYKESPRESMRAWIRHAGQLNCEDWMLDLAGDGAELHMRYPQWRAIGMEMEPEPAVPVDRAVDDLRALDTRFHAVLMCRSGAWVPSWCDGDFTALAESFPGRTRWIDDATHPRPFEFDEAAAAEYREKLERIR